MKETGYGPFVDIISGFVYMDCEKPGRRAGMDNS
jgi:hypothetical protein